MSLDLDKTDLRDGALIITNNDGSITCLPEDGATDDEKAMFDEFRQAYPDGKPQPVITPQEPQPTEIELVKQQLLETQNALVELQYNNLLKENGVM